MKLIMAVVSKDDEKNVRKEMNKGGFQVTKLSSTGGLLSKGNVTLLAGVNTDRLEFALDCIRRACQTRKYPVTKIPAEFRLDNSSISNLSEISVGGATIFVLNIEKFEKC